MPIEEINIGALIAQQNPVTQVWRIGIVVDIKNKYPTMIVETNRYSVKWFDNGELQTNFFSYAHVHAMKQNYDSGMFNQENTKTFDT